MLKSLYFRIYITILSALLLLSACSSGASPPATAPVFTVNARYTAGEFSYSCVVERTENAVSVTATSTAATGLCLTCDGSAVTFEKGDMAEAFPLSETRKTNPAAVLYSVFADVFGPAPPAPQEQDGLFYYRGSSAVGDYALSVNADGSLNTLSVPSAGISVVFD